MTYEYKCFSCDHEWELEQSIKDEAEKVCPKCGEETAQRLISGGTGHILKGGGWAREGYSTK
jgi:putative FmdB family regulatory protein